VRHPYCEDGSCGSAKPDDVRVVLDYSVKVPKSLAAPVDPTGCPGSLLGTDSKGDGAVREISNAYAKPVNTPIKAGAKKAGVVEYSIRAKARGATFQIRSSCGDSDHLGEVAIFEGKIPRARKEETPGEIGGKAVKRTYLSLQVAQVRTDLDHNDFTALVETCVRKKLPDPKGAEKAAASWWSISTSVGRVTANPEWNVLLPVYPYGSFAEEGGCASGWIGFKLGRNTESTLWPISIAGDSKQSGLFGPPQPYGARPSQRSVHPNNHGRRCIPSHRRSILRQKRQKRQNRLIPRPQRDIPAE
jgi:hypothetical protein